MRIFACDQCGCVLVAGPDGASARLRHVASDGVPHDVPSPSVIDLPWYQPGDGHDEVRAWMDAHPFATGEALRAAFPSPASWQETPAAEIVGSAEIAVGSNAVEEEFFRSKKRSKPTRHA